MPGQKGWGGQPLGRESRAPHVNTWGAGDCNRLTLPVLFPNHLRRQRGSLQVEPAGGWRKSPCSERLTLIELPTPITPGRPICSRSAENFFSQPAAGSCQTTSTTKASRSPDDLRKCPRSKTGQGQLEKHSLPSRGRNHQPAARRTRTKRWANGFQLLVRLWFGGRLLLGCCFGGRLGWPGDGFLDPARLLIQQAVAVTLEVLKEILQADY